MTAKEAKDITKKNSLTPARINEIIENGAKMGCSQCKFMEFIDDETKFDLMKRGFKLSYRYGLMGEQVTIVEW